MNYTELTLTVMLKKDIHFSEASFIIGRNINYSMLSDHDLKILHPQAVYKHYVFNSFFPLESDKIYRSGKLYCFKVRGVDSIQMAKMETCLKKLSTKDFEVISISKELYAQKRIHSLKTVMPVIITVDNGPWLQTDSTEIFIERLSANLEKKYRSIYNESFEFSKPVFDQVTFLNRKPFSMQYKGVSLLGHKIILNVAQTPDAQNLAFLALGLGLGEKNSSLGAGFCQFE